MRKRDMDAILKWAQELTDEELKKEYYDAACESLGSVAEKMYELGYDLQDIKEREKYEKYVCERAGVLGALCEERGIRLWE